MIVKERRGETKKEKLDGAYQNSPSITIPGREALIDGRSAISFPDRENLNVSKIHVFIIKCKRRGRRTVRMILRNI